MTKVELLDMRANSTLSFISLTPGIPDVRAPVAFLRENGYTVEIFPNIKFPRPAANGGLFFDIFGDEGLASVLRSTNGVDWVEIGTVNLTAANYPGELFTDPNGELFKQAFYKVTQEPPAPAPGVFKDGD